MTLARTVLTAGELQFIVRFERPSFTHDGQSKTATWEALGRAKAKFMPMRGAERVDVASERAEWPIKLRIRYSAKFAGLNGKDRFVFQGRTYDIQSVEPFGRNVGLDIVGVTSGD